MKHTRLVLFLPVIEGMAALAILLARPSESINILIAGLSPSRLVLAGAFIVLLALLTGMGVFLRNRLGWLESRLEMDERLAVLVFWLAVFVPVAIALPFVYKTFTGFLFQHTYTFFVYDYAIQAAKIFTLLKSLFLRSWSLYAWAVIQAGQVLAFILWRCRRFQSQPHFAWLPVILRQSLVLLVLLGAAFQWLLLYLHLDFLQYLDGWFWKFYDKPLQNLWIFPALACAFVLAVWLVVRFPRRRAINLLFLFLLGCALQWGFASMEKDGGLVRTYVERGRRAYPVRVCRGVAISDILLDYEQVHEGEMYFITKPPGTLLVYALAQQIPGRLFPNRDCFDALVNFMPWLFLPLTFIGLPLLARLGTALVGDTNGLLPALVLLTFPNLILIPMELDGALLPLFTIGASFLLWKAMQTKKVLWALAAGAVIYLGTYINFSLLPLLAFCLAWIVMDLVRRVVQRQDADWKPTAWNALGLLAGLAAMLLLFLLILHYDPLARYQAAMAAHRTAKYYQGGLEQMGITLVLNNAEFLTWIGIPAAVLLIAHLVRSGWAWIKQRADSTDAMMVAFFLVYAALNLAGQTRSEVARLWLFLLPVMAIFIAREARLLLRRKGSALVILVLIQLVTTFLLFAYQDFG